MRMLENNKIFNFSFGLHKDSDVIWIHFPYTIENNKFLKENLSHVKWSQSQKCWYVLDNVTNRKILSLPDKIYTGKDLLLKINEVNKSEWFRFVEFLRLKAYSENTIKTYATEFAQWLYALNNIPVIHANSEQLRSYLLYCITELKLSENQIHSRLNALKFYYEKVLLHPNFFMEIPRPKKKSNLPKVLSKQDIKKLFEVTTNTKHRMILKICYGLGLRVSEIVDLKIANIDSNRMLVHIENSKGKKDRYVPLPNSILDELRNYYKEFKPKVNLFENQYNQSLAIRSVQNVFKTAMTKAKINKKIGIHGLRHSYATHLLEYGTDMIFIQKLLGHSNIKTTEVYAKVSNTFLSKVISPLDQMDN